MNSSDHTSYPNPTIQESICEIVFSLQEGVSWHPSWFGEFFKQIQSEFTNFQPVPQISLVPGQPFTVSQGVRYTHSSRPLLLQLSERSMVITNLPLYPGWPAVLKDIEFAWDRLKQIIQPAEVTQIGLRYVNRIERSAPDETLGAWLMSTKYVPEAILTSLPGFVSVVQSRVDANNRANVTIGEHGDPSLPASLAFIFDIDRIVEKNLTLDTSSILEEATRLHADVWDVFATAKTERLERLLNGELL